jgi:hypothetical protein
MVLAPLVYVNNKKWLITGMSDQKSTPLTNVCDICDLENIVKCATCFTKGEDPTLIDVILTNRKSLLQNVMNCHLLFARQV